VEFKSASIIELVKAGRPEPQLESDLDNPDPIARKLDGQVVLREDMENARPRAAHPWFMVGGKRPEGLQCHFQIDGAPCYLLVTPEQFARCIFLVPAGGYLNIGRHIELPGRCTCRNWTLVISRQGRCLSLAGSPYHIAIGADPIAAYQQIVLLTRAFHMGERNTKHLRNFDPGCCSILSPTVAQGEGQHESR